ncbi:hypothetical protein Poli38472_013879 [Pythium oligandrum]|uniref:Endoplasmic oxidoreductin n=1 Tax=Pythium oligandrum TaxID=41045 RepID=A0A8K1C292_PYTOL|nr:hypothetical protein Poli38472_013879 [Pythium oligandrum]|eukprot:TMW55117.1 hypothetical protein Poli38472_013879 [Pythium oligandrum]
MKLQSMLRVLVAPLLVLTLPPSTTNANAPAVLTSSSSSASQQWQKLFPQDMYEYLQCQVCQTPELSGSVLDSGCNYETVDKAVGEHFHPLLLELSKLTFFRYFKVDLGKECPYWQDDGMCASRDCAVCECPQEEIPKTWYTQDKLEKEAAKPKPTKQVADKGCDEESGESELSRVDRTNAAAGENFNEWTEGSSPEVWSNQEEADNMMYINLLENPERYTGYSGYQAERIWKAIYQENCFTPAHAQDKELTGMCLEERVYYRLISGLQASINTHIALRYKHGDWWGPNPSLFVHRVGKHPERLQNLYFVYLFVMRAIGRYRDELLSYDFTTGNDADDQRLREILKLLVVDDKRHSSCPSEQKSVLSGFDERALFRVQRGGMSYDQYVDAKEQKRELELQFREKFQNVSRIMDCVTCEKCRLWGKLQTMGLGTAIKILLADDVRTMPPLQRNELIALINVANNFARSVDGVRMLRHLEFLEAMKQMAAITAGAIVAIIALILCLRKRRTKTTDSEKKNM